MTLVRVTGRTIGGAQHLLRENGGGVLVVAVQQVVAGRHLVLRRVRRSVFEHGGLHTHSVIVQVVVVPAGNRIQTGEFSKQFPIPIHGRRRGWRVALVNGVGLLSRMNCSRLLLSRSGGSAWNRRQIIRRTRGTDR